MEALNPWQSLPDFLSQRLVQGTIEEELRVLHVALLRLVSRGWRQAIDESLPVLAPRPAVAAVEAAAFAARCSGLQVLRLQCLIPLGPPDPAELSADRAAALAAICAGCPSLRSLSLLGWDHLAEAGLQPLPALSQLHTLKLDGERLTIGAACFSALRQLPRLRSLELRCYRVDTAGLATMSRLTSLGLAADRAGSELAPALASLTGLRHLGISRLRKGWSRLTQLTALTSLTSVSLHRAPTPGLQPIEVLLALLAGGSSGGGGHKTHGLRRVDVVAWAMGAAPVLQMAALSGLESLRLEYKMLQVNPASQVTCLAGLTALHLDVQTLVYQHHEEEVNVFLAAVGGRLTALRRLSLHDASQVSEQALVCISGLTALTALSLTGARWFEVRALSALLPLTDLCRLSLSNAPLCAYDVGAVLSPANHGLHPLLPQLTYLSISQCQMLSGSGLSRLVAALPSLRWLVHRGDLQRHRHHLLQILQCCHNLRLLQTSWLPAEQPSGGAASAAALSVSTAAAQDDLQRQQRPQLLRCLEDRAFCRTWRLRLQPGQHSGGFQMRHHGGEGLAAYHAFDAAQALCEAQQQPR